MRALLPLLIKALVYNRVILGANLVEKMLRCLLHASKLWKVYSDNVFTSMYLHFRWYTQCTENHTSCVSTNVVLC